MSEQQEQRGPVSWESHNFMRHEIARLQAENDRLTGEVAYWQHQTNHWYMKANHTPEQLAKFARRRATQPSLAPNSGIRYNGGIDEDSRNSADVSDMNRGIRYRRTA